MATGQSGPDTLVSAANLSGATNIGRVIALDANGNAVLAGADGADSYGILIHGGVATGDECSVAIAGMVVRGRAGAAFNEGARLTSDGNGRLVTIDAAAEIQIAVAKQAAGALGDLVDVLVTSPIQHHDGNG